MNNNIYQQQMYGGIGGVMPNGYQAQSNPNPPKYCQPLTAEEIESLKQNREAFTLGLTQEEMIRSICFHRDAQKRETLRPNADGSVTCLLCGKTFYPDLELDEASVDNATKNILDILQTTKLLYLDMPEEAAREFYQILALIEKIPKLYKIANDNFVKHENWQTMKYNYGPTTAQLYNTVAGGFGFSMNGAAPQPQSFTYGQPMAGYAQPQQMPYGQPQPQMGNPFGFNGQAPMMGGYAPQMTGYQYTPGTEAPAPVAAAPATEETKVDAQFTK